MGTEISLDIGGLSLDWSKNARGTDHGVLFQDGDRKRLRSDQINYDYFAESGEDPGLMEMALARRLKDVVPRLELLGFTLEAAQAEYRGAAEACREERLDLSVDESRPQPDFFSFKEFCAFATAQAVQSLRTGGLATHPRRCYPQCSRPPTRRQHGSAGLSPIGSVLRGICHGRLEN